MRRGRAKYDEECGEIHNLNQRLMLMPWEAVDSIRRAEHARVPATIDAANGELLAGMGGKERRDHGGASA